MKKIQLKTKDQINNIKESWKYLNELLDLVRDNVSPWKSLLDLELIADSYIRKMWVKWAFKGYSWFPANLCLSVNDCLVHGIPDEYVLKNGDLLKIDAWITYRWWISDAAISVIVWWDKFNPVWAELISATKWALDNAITNIKPNWSTYEFSNAIYKYIKNAWFDVIKYLTWHGVGNLVHEWPYIYNWPHPETKTINFKPWMVVALEPITAVRSTDFVEHMWNPWNLYTKWWDLGAQWEYTIAIGDNGYEILAGIV